MENHFFYFPHETPKILEKLVNRDWIIHNFKLEDNQSFYSPADIAYNVKNGIKYKLYLDTNLYQFLISSSKKSTELTRDATALLVFCQLSNILIEPSFAVYEKINYVESKADRAIEELALFYQIDNININVLIAYSLGQINQYPLVQYQYFDHQTMKNELIKYSKLKEWDSLYLIMLACVSIAQENMNQKEKLEKFRKWMLKDFRESLVGFIYAIIFFSQQPLKRMMKYKRTDSPETKKSQLYNMTWDLYIMNSFFRNWTSKEDKIEFIYATDDKALKELLRIAIEVQICGSFEPLKKILSTKDYNNLSETLKLEIPKEERIYQSKQWIPEYRETLIKKFERELLI